MGIDMDDPELKSLILNSVSDLVSDLMYYDRKEDADLPRNAIENAISRGVITIDEMIERFAYELKT